MSDPRFARLKTDPRFRRPKKKQQKVVIDERFKSVFDQARKGKEKAKPRVDKYGRRLPKTHDEDNLKKYYRLAPASDDENAEDDRTTEAATKPIDYARGKVLLESSDEDVQEEDAGDSDQSDTEDIVKIGGNDDELEIDLDEDTHTELDAQVAAYAKANKEVLEKEEREDTGMANRTRRLAVVNLDWDHVRASHLYKIFSSLVSLTAPHVPINATSSTAKDYGAKKGKSGPSLVTRGAVLSVKVYPSEFGKVRMEREEKEGPPVEVFRKRRMEAEEINEKTIYEVGDENEYDEDAFRRYQLERLRYYYAIIECDTIEAASHIYNELEGTELERSANVFNLSYVPDEMSFDDDPRDETTEDVSTDYKPLDYVTDALRHSKVKLTWDEDDPERHQAMRRQLTRQEMENADFRAYIASSSSEDESQGENEGKTKNSKIKDASRQKLRTLLLSGNDDAIPEGWDEGEGGDINMEITFTPGLSEKKDKEETTLDNYQKKIREKRKKRKEERKEVGQTKEGRKGDKSKVDGDEFFESGSTGDEEGEEEVKRDISNRQGKKGRSQTPPREETTAEELALIASSQNADEEPKHFDMKAVLRAEKHKRKKGKKSKKITPENELQEDFTIDVHDDRFKILHEDHQYAIDPTNPHFRKTKGMKAFLDERGQQQRGSRDEDSPVAQQLQVRDGENDQGLQRLVESVKRKSKEGHRNGKRRRM